MVDVDDGWVELALMDPEIVADALLTLHEWRRIPSDAVQVEEPTAPVDLDPPAGWGSRRPRSRMITPQGLPEAKAEAAATATAGRTSSPLTPLDFLSGGSGSSDDGGIERAKRSGSSETAAAPGRVNRVREVVVSAEPAPMVSKTPSPSLVGRPAKRKAKVELEAAEKSLIEEREMLLKEIESHKKVYQSLVADNQRLKKLKLSMEPQRRAALIPDLNLPFICEEFSTE